MEVIFGKLFLKDIQKITDKNLKSDINKAIEDFENVHSLLELSNIKKLIGFKEAYRLRLGKYRLGFYFDGTSIKLARLVMRDTIYKIFP